MADDDPLLLGLHNPGKAVDEEIRGVDDLQPHPHAFAEHRLNGVALAFPQETRVDEDAGEPVSHRPLYERGGDGAVHPAGQSADHLSVPHRLANRGELVIDDVRGVPAHLAAGDLEQEVPQHLSAAGRMGDFGVKL